MGGGSWTRDNYVSYCASTSRSYCASTDTFADTYTSSSQAFKQHNLHSKLDPKNVIRECCDSKEHPCTIPVILALDVTGSMGQTAIEVQKKLNPIMQELYKKVKDVELMVMAIGDLSYDRSPIQISQFESDIRIAENLDHIYFENGGGGNKWESYTAAWYMGARHTKLDCWKRGKKGIIITMGDEPINPYLPKEELEAATGDKLQADISTEDLYKEVRDKYHLCHICIESRNYPDQTSRKKTFDKVLGGENVIISSVEDLQNKIVDIVTTYASKNDCMIVETAVPSIEKVKTNENGEITW